MLVSVKACSVCGKPVMAGQGSRHLTCSPICEFCYLPIESKDRTASPVRHTLCEGKKLK